MEPRTTPRDSLFVPEQANRCLSCGEALADRRRRYCSVPCRQRLRRKLTLRTGLLKALNTRYATFYMTDRVIVLDILPYGAPGIYSFIMPRSDGGHPGDDFSRMADLLGQAWWEERRRTNRKYLASRLLLKKATHNGNDAHAVRPLEIRHPAVARQSLLHLRLNGDSLRLPETERVIKSAYRRQVKRHHPDHGGDAAAFRRIQQAYEELMDWAREPSFTRRRGFPDKWFYEGTRNRWVQPTPLSR
jgi:hypothetical protein